MGRETRDCHLCGDQPAKTQDGSLHSIKCCEQGVSSVSEAEAVRIWNAIQNGK